MMDGCKFTGRRIWSEGKRSLYICFFPKRMCFTMVSVWSDLSDYFANQNASLFTFFEHHKLPLTRSLYMFSLKNKGFSVFCTNVQESCMSNPPFDPRIRIRLDQIRILPVSCNNGCIKLFSYRTKYKPDPDPGEKKLDPHPCIQVLSVGLQSAFTLYNYKV